MPNQKGDNVVMTDVVFAENPNPAPAECKFILTFTDEKGRSIAGLGRNYPMAMENALENRRKLMGHSN